MAASEDRLFYDGLGGYAQRRGRHSEKLKQALRLSLPWLLFSRDLRNQSPRENRSLLFCSSI